MCVSIPHRWSNLYTNTYTLKRWSQCKYLRCSNFTFDFSHIVLTCKKFLNNLHKSIRATTPTYFWAWAEKDLLSIIQDWFYTGQSQTLQLPTYPCLSRFSAAPRLRLVEVTLFISVSASLLWAIATVLVDNSVVVYAVLWKIVGTASGFSLFFLRYTEFSGHSRVDLKRILSKMLVTYDRVLCRCPFRASPPDLLYPFFLEFWIAGKLKQRHTIAGGVGTSSCHATIHHSFNQNTWALQE